MAAISSISNSEAMSSVRTKLNSVITEINLLDPTDWTDYSATSTIVGWSSFSRKIIKYRVIGKQVFFIIAITGISNATTATCTLPYTPISAVASSIYGVNNGAGVNSQFFIEGSNVLNFYNAYTTWTSSGAKGVYCNFFIDIA